MSLSKDDILQPVHLKISRAEHHINNLNAVIEVYLLQKPLRLKTIGKPNTGKETHFIKEEIPLPSTVPLIIGDAIHNLRSALDIMIFTMIGDKAVKPESVQFPFCRRADALENTLTNRETHLAGKKVVDEIKRLKPYPGGHEWLSPLHTLDIADKHKLIIPTVATAKMNSAEFEAMIPSMAGDRTVDISWHKDAKFVVQNPGTRAQRRANRSNIRAGEYERDIQPAFQITFDEGQPYAGRAVIPILVEMVKEVRLVADSVCDAFLSEAA